jgi:hypothetical protein
MVQRSACWMTAALLAAVLLAAVLLSGCADEVSNPPPTEGDSKIVGFVTGGDGPVQARVDAVSVEPGGSFCGVGTATTDSTGRYEIGLPTGRYVLRARGERWWWYHGGAGVVESPAEADTIRLDGGEVRVDFEGGGLAIELRAPPELEGTAPEVRAWRVGGPGSPIYGKAAVEQGRVEIRFPMALPGLYAVGVKLSPSIQEYWLPGSYRRPQADEVTVVTGQTTSHEWSLPVPAHITGTIDGAWQVLGGESPQVASYADTTQIVSMTQTDRWGRYDLMLPLAASVRLRVDNGGVSRWIGGPSYESATTYDVTAGERVSDVNLRESGISCPIDLSGVSRFTEAVLTLRTEPDQAAAVTVHWAGGPAPSIPNLFPGTYSLQVERRPGSLQSWLSQWYDRRDSLTATPITIATEGEVVQVNVRLVEGGKILGRVLPGDGPAAYPWIVVTSTADSTTAPPLAIDFTTDHFEVMALDDGDYKVGVGYFIPGAQTGSPRPATIWWPDASSWGAAQVITIHNHARVEGIDFQLP